MKNLLIIKNTSKSEIHEERLFKQNYPVHHKKLMKFHKFLEVRFMKKTMQSSPNERCKVISKRPMSRVVRVIHQYENGNFFHEPFWMMWRDLTQQIED